MIDFHSHILPAIDDGAKNIDESVALLNSLYNQGVKKVVFTPHYYGFKSSVQKFIDRREKAYSQVIEQQVKGRIPSDMIFYKGGECYFDYKLRTQFDNYDSLNIENTQYILLELPFDKKWDSSLFKKLENLISETDFIPVIAHAEKYNAVKSHPELLMNLVNSGCLIQSNCDSFMSKDEKGLVSVMLEKGYISCLGSDTHSTDRRPPRYSESLEIINRISESESEKIQGSMEAILCGEKIKTHEVKVVKKFFGRYF